MADPGRDAPIPSGAEGRDDPLAAITDLFARYGDSEYGGEVVTQLEHALQAATLAAASGAADSLVAAALLHDLGHLLHGLPDDAPDRGIDDRHEVLAARRLARVFGPAVCDPIRLHVAAKRYLTAVEPEYLARLSEPSRTSLALQGGPMSAAEVRAFAAEPHWEAAVRLRRWDDEAKVAGLETPPLEAFADILRACLRDRPGP